MEEFLFLNEVQEKYVGFQFDGINRYRKSYAFVVLVFDMGRRYYPTVRVTAENLPYETAEVLLDKLEQCSEVRRRNKETQYERKVHNREETVNGYIKLSLTVDTDTDEEADVFASYTTDSREVEIIYQSDIKEDTSVFSEVINVFENTVYDSFTQVLDENSVSMNVATRTV